jgi:magnesium-transporting ATPase (P-type)
MRLHKISSRLTSTLLKIFTIMLLVGGILSLLEGCSPEWDGYEGASAVGAAFLGFSFIFYGVLWLIVSGWAIILYKVSIAKNKMSLWAAFTSIITGLLILYFDLLNYNPFKESGSDRAFLYFMHFFPGEIIGLSSGVMFLLLAVNYFITRIATAQSNQR